MQLHNWNISLKLALVLTQNQNSYWSLLESALGTIGSVLSLTSHFTLTALEDIMVKHKFVRTNIYIHTLNVSVSFYFKIHATGLLSMA